MTVLDRHFLFPPFSFWNLSFRESVHTLEQMTTTLKLSTHSEDLFTLSFSSAKCDSRWWTLKLLSAQRGR